MNPHSDTSLHSLVTDIEESHHTFTRDQIERIEQRLSVAGNHAPEALRQCFQTLKNDLLPHLMKEEQILFPYIAALELDPVHLPPSCFGSIAHPIRMMQFEHDTVKTLLAELRRITANYQPVADSAMAELYTALKALDDDLVEHIHQEDDVLFPRALQLEQAVPA